MPFDYFHEEQSEDITFFRFPSYLFTNEIFRRLSPEAKLVYGLLFNRVSLSRENKWIDDQGRVYIYFTLKSVEHAMNCSEKSATKYLMELESHGMIERIKQGQGKPAIIYVKHLSEPQSLLVQNRKDSCSRTVNVTGQDLKSLPANNINTNNIDFNNTNPVLSMDEDRRGYEAYIRDQLEIDYLKLDYPYDTETIEGIVDLILDVLCSKRETMTIAGDEKSLNVVKGQFMKLNSEHIRFVMDRLNENTTQVRNIKQYILAALYNAPSTIDSYYRALVNHDMATGKI